MKYILSLICLVLIGFILIRYNFPEYSHQVKSCDRNDYFVVENGNGAVNATFWIEGELTHDASVFWSDIAPGPDSVLKSARQIFIRKGKNISLVVGPQDYYADKMYIKYAPSCLATSGKLLIEVVIAR